MTLLLIVAAYVLGSVPFSLLFSRLFRLPDPRTYGSGNFGATNLMRSGKKTAAVLTLITDMGKGAIPIIGVSMADFPVTVIAAAGVAGVIGHVFSLFLRLQGGKGVATALGVFLAWEWRIGIIILFIWTGVFFISRISSLASLSAVLIAPLLLWYFSPPIAIGGLAIACLVFFRHKQNIYNLIHRKEQKFGDQ